MESCLAAMHLKVQTATNTRDGMDLLQAGGMPRNFDLLIIDRGQPGGLDGLEVARMARSQPGQTDLPVIVLAPAEQKSPDVELSGRKVVLVKPVTGSSLFDAVMQVFGLANRPQRWLQQKVARLERLESVRGRRLLVVEDNEINQLVAREMLEKAGLKVTIANNGQQALELVSGAGYDAVLMDIQMPGMDGYETTRRIREDARFGYEQLPIIAMTAHALSGDREMVLRAGFNDYVSKPIDAGHLKDALLRWLQPTQGDEKAIAGASLPEAVGDQPESGGVLVGPVELDTRSALERLDNNPLLYERLLRLAWNNYQQAGAEIRAALDANDIRLAHRLAHSLKGVAGTIGANELREAALQLEQALSKGEAAQYQSLLASLETNLTNVMVKLEHLV